MLSKLLLYVGRYCLNLTSIGIHDAPKLDDDLFREPVFLHSSSIFDTTDQKKVSLSILIRVCQDAQDHLRRDKPHIDLSTLGQVLNQWALAMSEII